MTYLDVLPVLLEEGDQLKAFPRNNHGPVSWESTKRFFWGGKHVKAHKVDGQHGVGDESVLVHVDVTVEMEGIFVSSFRNQVG
jgi:hypothetical protein